MTFMSESAFVSIPENLKGKTRGVKDLSEDSVVDIDQFVRNYNNSFEFTFVNPDKLNNKEKAIYRLTPMIIELYGQLPKKVTEIRISSTMRKDFFGESETLGCWNKKTSSIILARKTLK